MANVYFSHELIREKINSMLDTKVSMSQFMHSDDSLTAEAGMKIKVQKYVANDNIKDVAEGEGNIEKIKVVNGVLEALVEIVFLEDGVHK